jgi:hypothetical protein
MKCSSLKYSGREIKILSLSDTRARISPKMQSPQLLLTRQASKSPPNPQAHHWTTPTCHSNHNTLASLHTIENHNRSLSN